MKSRQRLFFYVLLNIFVSALVTGSILYVYNRYYQKDCSPTLPDNPVSTPSSLNGINVAIISIAGAGSLESEITTFQNTGDSPLVMTGWMLKNKLGSSYTFPQLTLYPGGIVQLHSDTGGDTASDLYWRRTTAAWSSGELAALYDSQGIARAFYRVP
jgi:hypothetical protein